MITIMNNPSMFKDMFHEMDFKINEYPLKYGPYRYYTQFLDDENDIRWLTSKNLKRS